MIEFNNTFWLILEYFGVASGLLYLYLEMKQKPQMWVLGLISSLLYIFVFAVARIYADMCFNIYNVAISIFGIIQWRKRLADGQVYSEQDHKMEYKSLSTQSLIYLVAISGGLYGVIYLLLSNFTDSPIPQGDAFTTSLSIVATWMLAQRYLSHWILWVIINIVSVYLYYLRGLYPTMLLYSFYSAAAIVGYWIWKKKGIKYEETTI